MEIPESITFTITRAQFYRWLRAIDASNGAEANQFIRAATGLSFRNAHGFRVKLPRDRYGKIDLECTEEIQVL